MAKAETPIAAKQATVAKIALAFQPHFFNEAGRKNLPIFKFREKLLRLLAICFRGNNDIFPLWNLYLTLDFPGDADAHITPNFK